MFEIYKQIAEEETGYKLTNKDFIIVLGYTILFFPYNFIIDIIKYLSGKYVEMLAYYCKFRNQK